MVSTTQEKPFVLVSWIAQLSDPYEKDRLTREFTLIDGKLSPGPTLNTLFHQDSKYREKISDVVFFRTQARHSREAIEQTTEEIQKRDSSINISQYQWKTSDPTDHQGLFDFCQKIFPKVRKSHPNKTLLLCITPGTKAMGTVMLIMAECGLIEKPFEVIKTFRPLDDKVLSKTVSLNLMTLFKVFSDSKPQHLSNTKSRPIWRPNLFRSKLLKHTFQQAQEYAKLSIPVFIHGERGTGKTTLASWIRANSPFRKAELDGAWPAVTCGLFSNDLMRAELFGYKKASFTGATHDKQGLVKIADGDTLFLDEIGDISHEMQRLLLFTLETGEFYPIGSTTAENSSFRLISATNLPWETLQEKLAKDFFDRVSYFRIRMPSLRELPEDLPWLWEEVFSIAQQQSSVNLGLNEKATNELNQEVIKQLQTMTLPGNLRDLMKVAYRICAKANSSSAPTTTELLEVAFEKDSYEHFSAPIVNEVPSTTSQLLHSTAEQLAFRFAQHQSFSSSDFPFPMDLKPVVQDFQHYLAEEIFHIMHKENAKYDDLISDLSRRTLQNWKNFS